MRERSEAEQRAASEVISKIKELRGRQKWSQADLARRAGLSVDAYARLERNEHSPSFASLMAIAGALEVPLRDLFPESSRRPALDTGRYLRLHAVLADAPDVLVDAVKDCATIMKVLVADAARP